MCVIMIITVFICFNEYLHFVSGQVDIMLFLAKLRLSRALIVKYMYFLLHTQYEYFIEFELCQSLHLSLDSCLLVSSDDI